MVIFAPSTSVVMSLIFWNEKIDVVFVVVVVVVAATLLQTFEKVVLLTTFITKKYEGCETYAQRRDFIKITNTNGLTPSILHPVLLKLEILRNMKM